MCAKVETLQEHTTLQLFTKHVDLLVFDLSERVFATSTLRGDGEVLNGSW